MSTITAIIGMRHKGWQHPQTQTVRPEIRDNGGDNTAAVEPKQT